MKILHIFLIAILIFSCTPDSYKVIENQVEDEDIKIIELRADSDKLLANGEAIMEFRTVAYGIREVKDLYKKQINDIATYHDSLRLDTFIIPQDKYSKDLIKVYDEDDNLIENNQFTISESNVEKIIFYAKAGELRSDDLEIKIREAADESYDELVIPIIFHVLMPPSYSVPAMKITTEVMQEKLDVLNVIYNKQRTTNPNGGNAKITFKLAKYDKYGRLLKQEGLNFVNLSENLSPNDVMDYMKEHLIWDPNKYLNVWIGDISGRYYNSDGSKSYKVARPNVILADAEHIAGIEAEEVTEYIANDDTELTDVGIVYNKADFLRPNRGMGVPFDFQTIMGEYLGLYPMKYTRKWDWRQGEYIENMVDGDTDFCPDTHVCEYAFSLYKIDMNTEKYFTTFNIMAEYSRKNSITVDQAKRIREVLEKCPSRWSYKSDWALTGE